MSYLLTDRPTEEAVGYYHAWLSEVWQRAHTLWGTVDSYYDRSFPVWDTDTHNKTRSSFRPSTPTSVLLHAIDNNLAFDPRVHREPVGETDAHRVAADQVEAGLTKLLEDCALKEMLLPWKQIGTHLIAYGYAVVDGPSLEGLAEHRNGTGNGDEAARRRAARRSWNPFRIRGTHPARILLNPQEKQPKVGVKRLTMTAQDLYILSREKKRTRKYAELFDMGKLEPMAPVEAIEFWTLYWHAVMAAGVGEGTAGVPGVQPQMLWVEKNPRGFVPFAHAFAGWGIESTSLTDNDPIHLAQGILVPIMDSLKVQAQQWSAKHTMLIKAAYMPWGTRQDPQEFAQLLASEGIAQGEEGDFWIMKGLDVPRWMFEEGREVDADIEFGTFPRALAGMREPGVSTVGQQAILSTAAQRKFAASARQLQHLATVTGQRVLQMIDTVSELEDGVMGIKRADLFHDYNVSVNFQMLDPLLDLQRRELGLREVQLDVKDIETYWEEDALAENTAERRRRLLRQFVRRHPVVLNLLAAQEARLMGETEEVATALEEEAKRTLKAMEEGQDVSPGVGSLRPTDAERDMRQEIAPGVQNPPRMT